MSQMHLWGAALLASCMALVGVARAEISTADWEAMKKEIADLRKENAEARKTNEDLAAKLGPVRGSVDKALDAKYGPGAAVGTKQGKLTISGMVQVWAYAFQRDNKALFQDNQINDIADTNEASDNSSFRVRRTELRFTLDLNEYVSAQLMIDPARESQAYPAFPDNKGSSGIFKRGVNANLANVQAGTGAAPRFLQDAYIEYRGHIPHHDFKIGQFKPLLGAEAMLPSSALDFVERSYVGQLADNRDQGAAIHGSWWDDPKDGRFQYWLGVFNGPGNYYGSGGQYQNRSDDNSTKDFNYRVLLRPLWKHPTGGSMELGWSSEMGKHGESGTVNPVDFPINGLNRYHTWAMRHYAWFQYMPGGAVRGLWFKGEWAWYKDRNAPNSVPDILGNSISGGATQDFGKAFPSSGWNAAIGYKLMNSRFADDVPKWARGLEFAFRYDTFQTVQLADLVVPDHTDVFSTRVFTAGVNYYYIKNNNSKIQLNYNVVDNPESGNPNRQFHNVRNDSLVLNFQVVF